jgi:hypothetical protein
MSNIYAEIDTFIAELQQKTDSLLRSGAEYQLLRLNIPAVIEEVERSLAAHRELLQPWLGIAELAIEVLIAIFDYLRETAEETGILRASIALIGRAASHAVAIRRLVTVGQDEVARVVMRSFIENLDVALAAIGDSRFAELLADEGFKNEKRFWQKHIRGGAVQRKVEEVLERAGIPSSSFQERRAADLSFLSGSTHPSFMSAVRGSAIPSLAHGTFVSSPLGHIGVHGPNVLRSLALNVTEFSVVLFKFSYAENAPRGFRTEDVRRPEFRYVVTGFFTLQEIVKRHNLPSNGNLTSASSAPE